MKETIVARIRGLKESNPELFKDKVEFLMVEDEELFHIVQGGRDIVESGQALIEAAKENGGTDNIGVVLIEPFADEVSVL